mgnify:CR=1 FL=1
MYCHQVIEILAVYCKKIWHSDIIKVDILKANVFRH